MTRARTARRPARRPALNAQTQDARDALTLRRAAAEKRIELAPLRRRIAQAEAAVTRLTAEIARIDSALAEAGLFARDPAKAGALAKARADHADALAKAEEEWLEASALQEERMANSE